MSKVEIYKCDGCGMHIGPPPAPLAYHVTGKVYLSSEKDGCPNLEPGDYCMRCVSKALDIRMAVMRQPKPLGS